MQDYVYSTVGLIAIAVLLIVNYPTLVGKYVRAGLRGAKSYRRFLTCVLAYHVTDVLWGVFAGMKSTHLLYLDTAVYFIVMAMATYYWCEFQVDYMVRRSLAGRVLVVTGVSYLGLTVLMLAVNPWTGCFFWFNEAGAYNSGWFRRVEFDLQIALFAFCAILSMRQIVRARSKLRFRYATVALFELSMIGAIVAQLGYPLLPFYSLGCLIGICFLNIFVVEADREAEDERRLKLDAEHEAERRMHAARSYFFSTVSHDIRTPLNAIIGFLDLLKGGISEPQEREAAIETAVDSGRVLMALVNNVLDLSMLEDGKLKLAPVAADVRTLTERTLSAFRLACSEKGIALKSEVAEMPKLVFDPNRLGQILFNLIGNAVKFTESGAITVGSSYEGGTLNISVKDTGCGIPEDDLDRLMTPYVQIAGAGRHGGTGLGLAVCKQLAELMGGNLSVRSVVGLGSVFTVTLPGVEAAKSAAEPSSDTAGAAAEPERLVEVPAAELRVLLVDDSPVNLTVGCSLLRRCGVTKVTTAANGRLGVEAFRELMKAGVRDLLVLTDMWMPELNGEGLAREIRAMPEAKGVRILALTADVEAQKLPPDSGFDRILLKPLTLAALKGVLGIA